MKTYTPQELREILNKHRDYLNSVAGGTCANLWGADLRGADLRRADLRRADLRRADLRRADLGGADLGGANLWGADLRRADLGGANLWGAYLGGAEWSDSTQWPAITAVLLADWGEVSDDLCRDLMRYDACNHPDPAAFDRWAKGGPCPYSGLRIQRAAHFTQKPALWSPGPVRPWDVFQRLLAEKLVKVS